MCEREREKKGKILDQPSDVRLIEAPFSLINLVIFHTTSASSFDFKDFQIREFVFETLRIYLFIYFLRNTMMN